MSRYSTRLWMIGLFCLLLLVFTAGSVFALGKLPIYPVSSSRPGEPADLTSGQLAAVHGAHELLLSQDYYPLYLPVLLR